MTQKEVFKYLEVLKTKDISDADKNALARTTIEKYIYDNSNLEGAQVHALYDSAATLADSVCLSEIFSVVVSLLSIFNIMYPKNKEKDDDRYTEIDSQGNVYIKASKMYDAILKLKAIEDYEKTHKINLGDLK